MSKKETIRINWDALGIFTSIACAIHCAVLPLFISVLPFFGINLLHNAFFEWGMILLAFLIGSFSLLHGHRKHHRSYLPLYIFAAGFVFLILKQFLPLLEYGFLAVAVVCIVTAHYHNFRLCRRSKSTSPHHVH